MEIQQEKMREVRIALVLYGGVSLAVYENGVTRCFYDLVRSRGVFSLLLDLLDAKAVVDVVTGASAGGINGLMLAAALESGQDFAQMATLWRDLGDLGALLRKPGNADEADSLLDGRYFHQELIKAFETLCRVDKEGYRDPGEMDVFIAATDLDGHLRHYQDSLGRDIDDKEHRVIFHLQHRPGRKALGIPAAKEKVDPALQAKILGTVARATAGFPMAFQPLQGQTLERAVQKALNETSSLTMMESRSLIDGGVLDNKPFGPVLQAIFYRMPEGIVERRLFYVEPDPVPFVDKPQPEHTPLRVGFSAISSIPGHEGIADDLEKLLQHNEKVRWFEGLKNAIENARQPQPVVPSAAYVRTRVESVCRAIVIDCNGAPSVRDYPRDAGSIALLDGLRHCLTGRIGSEIQKLDRYDIAFHLRRAFHLLYSLYADLEKEGNNERIRLALRKMGRVIKALKVILSYLMIFREQFQSAENGYTEGMADRVIEQFIRFLSASGAHWSSLDMSLGASESRQPSELFDRGSLTVLSTALRSVRLTELTESQSPVTVLDRIAEVVRRIICECDGNGDRFAAFSRIDESLYSLTFAGDIHELDLVKFVRISPADAQIGLSQNSNPHAKVAGDGLAHFSAFLRRDWRSNDMLQGRFDGTCQIIQSLLDDEALNRVLQDPSGARQILSEERIRKAMPCCTEGRMRCLCEAWNALLTLRSHSSEAEEWRGAMASAVQSFREQLILAGQEEALQEDIESVYFDLRFQEIKFGRISPHGITAGAADALIKTEALNAAREDLGHIIAAERAAAFRDMRLGDQEIFGPKGSVPNAIMGEYGTLAYLLFWGMLRKSLGKRAATFLDKSRVRTLLRTPIAFMYMVFSMLSREPKTALALIMLAVGIMLGGSCAAFFLGHYAVGIISTLLIILALALSVKLVSGKTRTRLCLAVWTGIIAAAATVLALLPYWIQVLKGMVKRWACQ